MNTQLQTLEEGVAALATVLCDDDLRKAAEGAYGPEIRLLSIGEKARRDRRPKRAAS